MASGIQGLMGLQPVEQIVWSAAAALGNYVQDQEIIATGQSLKQTTDGAQYEVAVVFVVCVS